MRSVFLVAAFAAALPATAANAADIYRAPEGVSYKDAPVYAPVWTGFYVGADIGGAWGNADIKDITGGVPPGPFSFSPSGVLAGGAAGYNLQSGNFVFGVEGDIGYLDLHGSTIIPILYCPISSEWNS